MLLRIPLEQPCIVEVGGADQHLPMCCTGVSEGATIRAAIMATARKACSIEASTSRGTRVEATRMASYTAACQWAPRCRAMSKASRTSLASSGLLLFFLIRVEMLHSHLLHLSFTALLISGMDESAVVWQPHIIDTQWDDACVPVLPYRVATAAESIFFHMSEFRAEGPGLSNGTSSAAQQPQQDASAAAPHLEEQPLPEVHLPLLLRTMQHVWPQYLFPQGP